MNKDSSIMDAGGPEESGLPVRDGGTLDGIPKAVPTGAMAKAPRFSEVIQENRKAELDLAQGLHQTAIRVGNSIEDSIETFRIAVTDMIGADKEELRKALQHARRLKQCLKKATNNLE